MWARSSFQDGFFVNHLADSATALKDAKENHAYWTRELAKHVPDSRMALFVQTERRRLAGIYEAIKRVWGL
jgi:hypothetical protein